MSTYNLAEYQARAVTTAIYDDEWTSAYPLIGLANEAGELAKEVAKFSSACHSFARMEGVAFLHGGDEGREYAKAVTVDKHRQLIKGEAGDVLWYAAAAARDLELWLPPVFDTTMGEDCASFWTPEQAALHLCATTSEALGLVKKSMRDDKTVWAVSRTEKAKELVDRSIHELAGLLWLLGVDFAEAADANLAKLASRAKRGVLNGDGGER
ncbi:hypothetical protein ACMX2H_15945 [Arthrobacter sulfonylureivorans]|uniref:hypothetical protein n=1 Tax=Arthrobacter sulfonylureivorans TaxID=2486855 RepID=UPI0039E329ED